jgi:hypothetical protein
MLKGGLAIKKHLKKIFFIFKSIFKNLFLQVHTITYNAYILGFDNNSTAKYRDLKPHLHPGGIRTRAFCSGGEYDGHCAMPQIFVFVSQSW